MSVFRVFLVRIFPNSNWIGRFIGLISVFSPNAGKHGLEKLLIQTLFTQCCFIIQIFVVIINWNIHVTTHIYIKSRVTLTYAILEQLMFSSLWLLSNWKECIIFKTILKIRYYLSLWNDLCFDQKCYRSYVISPEIQITKLKEC